LPSSSLYLLPTDLSIAFSNFANFLPFIRVPVLQAMSGWYNMFILSISGESKGDVNEYENERRKKGGHPGSDSDGCG
jgi:hypothetical protein